MLERGDFELEGSAFDPRAKLLDVPARCNIEGFVCFFIFAGDGLATAFVDMKGFAGVFVGDNDMGTANAADTFLFTGIMLLYPIFRIFVGWLRAVEVCLIVVDDELGIGGNALSS